MSLLKNYKTTDFLVFLQFLEFRRILTKETTNQSKCKKHDFIGVSQYLPFRFEFCIVFSFSPPLLSFFDRFVLLWRGVARFGSFGTALYVFAFASGKFVFLNSYNAPQGEFNFVA